MEEKHIDYTMGENYIAEAFASVSYLTNKRKLSLETARELAKIAALLKIADKIAELDETLDNIYMHGAG